MFNATIHNHPMSRQCKQLKGGKMNTIRDIIDSLDISQSQNELDPNMYIKNMDKKLLKQTKNEFNTYVCSIVQFSA